MDNNKKQNQNMNSNWQTIAMLVVAALLTIMIVSWMNSAVESRQRKELSYNEFVQMVEDGKVESIRVKDAVIEVMPKAEATEYSQQMKYYVVYRRGLPVFKSCAGEQCYNQSGKWQYQRTSYRSA